MAIALDASSQTTWKEQSLAGAVTSNTFSPPANSLIVVYYYDDAGNSTADSTASITNTGTALSWTRQVVANNTTTSGTLAAGVCIFYAVNAASQSSITVTVTPSGTPQYDTDVVVGMFTGHNPTTPIGASGVGTSSTAGTAISYTATAVGSMGTFAIGSGYLTASLVVGAGTTNVANTISTNNVMLLAGRQTTASTGLTTQTMNATNAAANPQYFVYVEIMPAVAGVRFDVSTAGVAYTLTGSQTTSHAGNASARAAVVMIDQNGTAADEVSGVTYGGAAMTRLRFDTEATEAGGTYIYWLNAVATGTQNVIMTTTAATNKQLTVATMLADAGGSVDVAGHNTGTSASVANPSWTISGLTAATQLSAFEVIHSGLVTMTTTPAASWTLLTATDLGTQGRGFAYQNVASSGTTLTCGWTAATADNFVGSAVAFYQIPDSPPAITVVRQATIRASYI